MFNKRHLEHTKAFKTLTGTGVPQSRQGNDGDLTIRQLKDGLFLFAKYGNLWYRVGQLEVHNPKHSNQTVLNAMSGTSGNAGQTAKGASGNTGIGTGAKFFLDTIKTRLGIKGKNYIQSGTSAASLGRDSTNSDTSFMNLALDNKPILILSGIKGSDSTPETLTFKSTLNHANGPILHFLKTRSGGNGLDGDDIGQIKFSGANKVAEETDWAQMLVEISNNDDGDESGKLTLSVAASDGADSLLKPGLILEGEEGAYEVDVYIGYGTSSLTTIAGDLDIDGDRITSASHLYIIPSTGDVNIDVGRHINLDAGTGAIFATKASGTYTPTTANEVIPKHYLDANTYHFIKCGFSQTTANKVYLPIAGSDDQREDTNPLGEPEKVLFICPYNGSVEKVMARSEEACGSSVLGIHIASDGTEMPSTTATQSVTVDMAADDTSYEFDFASAGTNTFTKGQVIMFSFDPTSTMNDISFTIVLKFDVST